MKVLGDLYHLPSGSHYLVGILESEAEKNEAYALLYDRYVSEEEAPVPWKFPHDNPSGLCVENRSLPNGRIVKVLVDDFEATAVVGGIQCAKTGELVGTGRILVRNHQYNQQLEVERYDSLPHHLRESILPLCDAEGNRSAVKPCLHKKRCSQPLFSALMAATRSKRLVYAVDPKRLNKVPFASSGCRGHFRYSQGDPSEVALCSHSIWAVSSISRINAMSAATLYISRISRFVRSSLVKSKAFVSIDQSDETLPVEQEEGDD